MKSNLNSTVTLTPNLTGSLSTLRFFFGDASVCKGRTWQIVRNLLKIFHSIHVWYHEILTNLVIFRLRLLFLEFKNHSATSSWSCFLNKMFENSFHFPSKALNNMNIISPLNLFHYLNHLQFKFDFNKKIPLNTIN